MTTRWDNKVYCVHVCCYFKTIIYIIRAEKTLYNQYQSNRVVIFFFNSNKVNTDLYCCYLLDLVTSLFPLDVDEPDSLSCLKAFFRKNAIASWAPRLDRSRDRQTMLPTSRSPLAIICREDFLPGSLHDDVLAVWVEGTAVPAVVWEAAKLASMAVSKSWGNFLISFCMVRIDTDGLRYWGYRRRALFILHM